MSNTNGSPLQHVHLGRLFYDDGVIRNRPDVLRIKLIADGKNQLGIFVLGHTSCNGAENVNLTI
jgi:hypothetical protein